MSDDTSADISDLLNQIKPTIQVTKEQKEEFSLDKEKLEQFLLDNSGKLIKDSLEYIQDIGQFVSAAPDSRDVEALAKLTAATAAAIESLNKIHIADQKNVTAKEIKHLDIESKKALQQTDINNKLLLNREELMNKLIQNAEIIEIEEETN